MQLSTCVGYGTLKINPVSPNQWLKINTAVYNALALLQRLQLE